MLKSTDFCLSEQDNILQNIQGGRYFLKLKLPDKQESVNYFPFKEVI